MKQAYRADIRHLLIRTATAHDLPLMHAIADRAITEILSDTYYTPEQIQAVKGIGLHQVERDLVDAGTYYVAEVDGVVVGGSGWSAEGRLSSSGVGPAVKTGTAAMRGTYVEPQWAHRGIATLLVRTTESAAKLSGFQRFQSMCTPASVPIRRALGYKEDGHEQVRLAGGLTLDLTVMLKQAA
jgi:GNAT superfamily N-acetyltransferase